MHCVLKWKTVKKEQNKKTIQFSTVTAPLLKIEKLHRKSLIE